MSKLKKSVASIILPLCLIILWEVLTIYTNILPSSLNAKPTTILKTLPKFFYDDDYKQWNLLYNTGLSLTRLLLGVSIGSVLGILLAYFNNKSNWLRILSNPTLKVIGPIPIIIWIPVFIMLFNSNNYYKSALIAFATFLLIYLTMFTSFNSMSKKYIELGKIYQKSHWTIFWSISFPNSLEIFLTSLRFSIAIGWIVLFVVEYSIAKVNMGGLGYMIERFRHNGKVEEMFASVLMLALVSYLLDRIILLIMHKKLKWIDYEE